jgi:hypothetical protein
VSIVKKVVELEGVESDLEYLATLLSSETLSVEKIEKLRKYVLWHSEFDAMQTTELYLYATNLIGVINGCAKLRRKKFSAIELVGEPLFVKPAKGVYEIINDETINVIVFADCVTASAEVPSTREYKARATIRNTTPTRLKLIFKYSLLNAAMEDEKMEEALRYFGNLHDWFNLYKIFEAIQEDPNDSIGREEINRIDASLTGSKRISELFTQTANVYRHHYNPKRFKLPEHPMSLNDAEEYVESLLNVWCFRKMFES